MQPCYFLEQESIWSNSIELSEDSWSFKPVDKKLWCSKNIKDIKEWKSESETTTEKKKISETKNLIDLWLEERVKEKKKISEKKIDEKKNLIDLWLEERAKEKKKISETTTSEYPSINKIDLVKLLISSRR
jgi:hypothetical protein